MWALFEGLWYSLWLFIQIIWIPAVIIIGIGLIARIIGIINRAGKKKK